jgi:hypothetical protein
MATTVPRKHDFSVVDGRETFRDLDRDGKPQAD